MATDIHGLPHVDPEDEQKMDRSDWPVLLNPEAVLYREMKPPPEDDEWLEVTDGNGHVIRRWLASVVERVVAGPHGWPEVEPQDEWYYNSGRHD
jgi:hypothetical protein